MLTCLNLLAGIMDGSESEAGAAESMLTVLSRVACTVPVGHKSLQVQLCRVLLHVAMQYPGLSHHVTGLLPLLAESGSVGDAVSVSLQLLLQQLGATHLDVAFSANQVSDVGCHI